jgi:hypothetical protein
MPKFETRGAILIAWLINHTNYCILCLRAGRRWVDSQKGHEIVLYSTAPRPALGPTQPPIQWIQGALSSEIRRHRRVACHWPPFSAEVKIGGAISSLSIFLHGVVLN